MAISNKTMKNLKYIGIGFTAGVANGLFGSGGGTIAVPAMVFLLEEEEHKAHATALLIILPLTMVSAYFYLSNSYVDWNLTWKAMAGGVVGGAIGAYLLNKCPSGVLRKIFGAFMIIAAIRMIL
ncbi:MAG: sulfite exporter TauE/SafE family protein [Ruminiclostridium sp.]